MVDTESYNSAICRLCAETTENGETIFTSDSQEANLSEMINQYLPIKIHDDEKLPRTICSGCHIQLEATVQFFQLLISGQKKIRQIYMQQDKIVKDATEPLSQIDTNIYPEDHELNYKMKGLNKPARKRGRPPKVFVNPTQYESTVKVESNDAKSDYIETDDDLPSNSSRKKRRIQLPKRFMESVRGVELDRILIEDKIEVDHKKHSNKSQENSLENNTENKFVCDICGEGFCQPMKYIMHKNNHKITVYECNECNSQFYEKDLLLVHQEETDHKGEKLIDKDFEETEDLGLPPIDSCENLSNNQDLENPDVDSNVVSGGENAFDASDNDNQKAYKCKKCNKHFKLRSYLIDHIKVVHEGKKPYVCQLCNKAFAYQTSLNGHIEIVHKDTNDDKTFLCDKCGQEFNDINVLSQHKLIEHNSNFPYNCDNCGKGFKHKQLLHRHQLVHSDDRPYPCQTCNASFKTKANLMNHLSTHTGEKKHCCERCGQQFAHKTSLTLHYRWHTGQKPYKCEVCSKGFSQNGNLQEHLRIHTGEKPYCCDHCGRSFTTSSQFKLHVKRHTGERPWKCEFCSKTFLHKDTWKCHVRRHKGERPFQCAYCNRGFTEQWALKKHLRLHTGEKPYSCEICGKLFADCSNLTKHKKVHRNPEEKQIEKKVSNHKVATIFPNSIKSSTDENVSQLIFVAYNENSKSFDAGGNDSNEQNVSNIETENTDPINIDITSEDLQLHITDEQGNPLPITMEQARQLLSGGNFDNISAITDLNISNSSTSSLVNGEREIIKDFQDESIDANSVAVVNQMSIDDDIESADGKSGNEININEDSGLNDGQQTIEFTTQDGQKVRLVTALNVDPVQLAYLTMS